VPSPTLYLSARLYTSMSGNLHRADERISFGHFDAQRCTAAPAEAACAAAVERSGLVVSGVSQVMSREVAHLPW
jgi:hypothetical protein